MQPRLAAVGRATMTMSDGRVRHYLVHGQEPDVLLITPGDADSALTWACPYPVKRGEFTAIHISPAPAGLG